MIAPSSYPAFERLLHRVAFDDALHGIALQKAAAGIEDTVFARDAADTPPARPVFVAGLSRGGTTLLLNLLAELPEFATHTYREMPFVLCPMLWNRFSRPFRKPAHAEERAHGDGIAIGYDSPEAFEEILWMAFWPEKYRDDRIRPWTADDRDAEFEAFFARHMHKLIAIRADERPGHEPSRYLSKNYANIARLPLLAALFPDCRIVVPLRDPWSHAGSLLRQHRRFRDLHAREPFARRYMAWLGHFEFGGEFKPIAFSGRPGDATESTDGIDFWLRYWIAAHEAIDDGPADNVVLFDYAALCDAPVAGLTALADAADADARPLRAQAGRIGRSRDYVARDAAHNGALLRRADELYAALRRRCVNAPAPKRHRG